MELSIKIDRISTNEIPITILILTRHRFVNDKLLMQRSITVTVLVLALVHFALGLIDILTEGAVSHVDKLASQFQNSKIITNSILKANLSMLDRTVRIPRGHTFYSMPIVLHNIYNVTIII